MVLLNHRKNLAKIFQKGLKAMNRTKTANTINAHVEIQNQFVFIFTANEEATNKEVNEETANDDEEEASERVKFLNENEEVQEKEKRIESLDQKIIAVKCEVDNYNLHISKKTGETFERLTHWSCRSRLNIRDINEAKDKVKEMKREIEILEKEVKELREELRERFNYYC
jgi:archaellum component FlaC